MLQKVNCIIVDDEPVAREILENHLSRINAVNVLASCKSAIDAFNSIITYKVDLVFLDINMPEISGLSFARSINKDIKVIFTTAYREYAVDGFDLQAVDYLLKPIAFERLLQSVNKYLHETTAIVSTDQSPLIEETNDYFFVRADRKMVKVNFTDILFIECIGDYVKIHLTTKTVLTRETVLNLEAKLPNNDFLRVHRSFIVRISKIDSYTSELIEIGQKQIPISRGYKTKVIELLENQG